MISDTAIVSPRARLADGVVIGDFSVVHDNVVLENGVVVGSHCVLGHPAQGGPHTPLHLGEGAHVRSHSVLYEGSTFGPGLVTGHHVTIRERTKAGPGLQVGTLSDLQGHASFGDYVKMHSNVHIGQLSEVGSYVWIFPYTVLTNDPHPPSEGHLRGVVVEDYAVVTTASTVMPGIRIGTRSLVAAHSLVNKDVPPDKVVGGVPAKILADTSAIQLKDGSGPAYPWMRHFHRGYPPEVVSDWLEQFGG